MGCDGGHAAQPLPLPLGLNHAAFGPVPWRHSLSSTDELLCDPVRVADRAGAASGVSQPSVWQRARMDALDQPQFRRRQAAPWLGGLGARSARADGARIGRALAAGADAGAAL